MDNRRVAWIIAFVIVGADINDLFRPMWFFESVGAVIFWNCFGLLALLYLFLDKSNVKGVRNGN